MGSVLDRIVGGWQVAGNGSINSNWFALPSSNYGAVSPVQTYGTQYPIQDCRSGACYNGYLYWNGYLSQKVINARNAAGQCVGVCGVPSNYQPADPPLIAWGQTSAPNMPAGTNISGYWDTNTVWVPLKDGTVVRTTMNTNLNPLQNQYILGPFNWGLNASLFKVVQIRESMALRFNADFFNVLNRPGIPQPGSDGVITLQNSANMPRLLQLTVRLTW
jgi:hypothetical protein